MAPSPEVKQKFDNRLHPKPDAVGYLGIPNGIGGYTYDMPFRPGSIYARIQLGVEFEIGEVRAGGVARDPNLKLNFFKVNGILTAQNPNGDGAVATYGANANDAYLVPHSLDHHLPAVAAVDFGGWPLINGGAAHFNAAGLDENVQIEGLSDPDLLYTKASTDRVGIGTASPTEKLDVQGNIKFTGNLLPNADNTSDLGSTSKFLEAVYAYGVWLKTRAAPATPAAGSLVIYAGTDKHPHAKNEDGTDFDLSAANDPEAFHKNVDGEIEALPNKPLPVITDVIVAENSQGTFEKVSVTLESLRDLFLGLRFVQRNPVWVITDSTTETSLQDTGDPIYLPGLAIGFSNDSIVKTETWGIMSTAAVAGNVQVRAYLETDLIADTGAIALPSAATDVPWYLLLFAVPIYTAFPTGGMRTWGKLVFTLAGADLIYPLNSGLSILGSTDISDGANFDVTLQYDTADAANVWNVVAFKCSVPPN